MSTARATLHADLVKLLGQKDRGDLEGQLDELLTGYRVQFKKPGENAGKTARDALRDDVVGVARKPGKDLLAQLAQVLDGYRMQTKAAAGTDPKAPRAKKPPRAAAGDATAAPRAAARAPAPAPSRAAPARPAPARPAPPIRSPAPAGPSRGTSRSECPKCHSMGVVLARSYASDEYYSCIYCGWQGFKPVEAMEAEDSLAARLLGVYSGAPIVDVADGGEGDDET